MALGGRGAAGAEGTPGTSCLGFGVPGGRDRESKASEMKSVAGGR